MQPDHETHDFIVAGAGRLGCVPTPTRSSNDNAPRVHPLLGGAATASNGHKASN